MELEVETKLSAKPVLEPHDATALTKEQQRTLDEYKIKTRIENELYLRHHPEVSLMLSAFISDVLKTRPPNIKKHAADYFTDPCLSDKVKAEHVRITAASKRIIPEFN
eukprot:Em0009g680a